MLWRTSLPNREFRCRLANAKGLSSTCGPPPQPFQFRSWKWWSRREVSVDLAPDEVERITDRIIDFMDYRLSGLILEIVEEIAPDLLSQPHKTWSRQFRRIAREQNRFESRVQ